MSLHTRIEPILPLIETLVGCQDPLLRDRVLVQAAAMCSGARGIALWRPTRKPGGELHWLPVLTHGDPVGLPQPSEVQAVLAGTLGGELGSDRHVLACSEGPQAWAVATSGASDEDSRALIESLFALAFTLEMNTDPVQPPLPSPRQDSQRHGETSELRHDMRNLLTTLRSACDYVEQFAHELDAAETRRVDDVVARDLGRIGGLFVRALDGAAQPSSSWSPKQLILDVLDSLRPEFEAAGLTITANHLDAVDAPEGLAEVDAWRIVENLVRNALEALGLQHMACRGVTLSWTRSDDACVLSVEDDGPGLAHPAATLFEHGVTHGKATGSGLGLSIVRDLVERSGGRVRAYSRPTGGAAFTVSWAAHDASDGHHREP